MHSFIVNGSPRKKGGTSLLVNRLAERLEGDVTVYETYTGAAAPCIDCRYCWTHPDCAIGDAMQGMYEAIREADNIVIASPIYFGELTGSLLQWASRLQFFYTARRFRGVDELAGKTRRGAVLLVDGGDGYMETALAMGKRLLKMLRTDCGRHVYFSGTDHMEPVTPDSDRAVMRELDSLGDWLNER